MNINKEHKIDVRHLYSISRIFTPLVLNNIAIVGRSPYLAEIWHKFFQLRGGEVDTTFRDFLNRMYRLLRDNYRNEYIYKNAIAKKILCGKHSPNTTTMLSEFRVGICKADAVIINGTATVYEIKTELDTLARLGKQIKEYLKIFEFVNIITTEKQANIIKNECSKKIGIKILTDRYTIATIRDPLSNKANIQLSTLFDSLRKKEYLQIIKDLYGKIPNMPNTQIFTFCKNLYIQAPFDKVYNLTMNALKKRSKREILTKVNNEVSPLLAYAISNAVQTTHLTGLMERLNIKMQEIIQAR